MKKLDLNAYGVVEMNVAEAQHLNGGIINASWYHPLKWIIAGLITVVEAMDIGERFMEGWNSVDCGC